LVGGWFFAIPCTACPEQRATDEPLSSVRSSLSLLGEYHRRAPKNRQAVDENLLRNAGYLHGAGLEGRFPTLVLGTLLQRGDVIRHDIRARQLHGGRIEPPRHAEKGIQGALVGSRQEFVDPRGKQRAQGAGID